MKKRIIGDTIWGILFRPISTSIKLTKALIYLPDTLIEKAAEKKASKSKTENNAEQVIESE